MKTFFTCATVFLLASKTHAFQHVTQAKRRRWRSQNVLSGNNAAWQRSSTARSDIEKPATTPEKSIWESMASAFFDYENDPSQLPNYIQVVTCFRVLIPSFTFAFAIHQVYPSISLWLAHVINDSGVFAVVSQDSSQFIQNILTTSGLTFSILVGQTYYFMYQQQEAIYLALYEEVTAAKSLLEQVGLICRGREELYAHLLECIDRYVEEDLTRFNDVEPAILISERPSDDPLEDILYLTSVGEPSTVYETVRSLRLARSYRLGALQKKLPGIHMFLLWALAAIVLFTFPLLGAGSQTIGGSAILAVQAWYLSFIVFGMSLTIGVIQELRSPAELGAYNAQVTMNIMVSGLKEELELRLSGKLQNILPGPSLDLNYPEE